MFGVAVLATVFAHRGAYATPAQFADGFTAALWVGVGLSALGALAALVAPRHRRRALTAREAEAVAA